MVGIEKESVRGSPYGAVMHNKQLEAQHMHLPTGR